MSEVSERARELVDEAIITDADPAAYGALLSYIAALEGSEEAICEGVRRISRERRRQQDEEGWTSDHDDRHTDGSLSMAGACYAVGPERVHVRRQVNSSRGIDPNCYQYDYTEPERGQIPWPWEARWWKPSGDEIRDLEKAGALIAAEIDRLVRRSTDPSAQKSRHSDQHQHETSHDTGPSSSSQVG